MNKRFKAVVGLISVITMGLVSSALGQPHSLGGSPIRTVTCPSNIKASQCSYVKVPLDHQKPEGPTIELFVAVQKASASEGQRQPDPLFYLEGGPGGPSSPAVNTLGQVFPNRDVVGIDQRGVGLSRPQLSCPPVVALMKRQDLKSGQAPFLFSKALLDCAKTLRGQGVALELFNTTQAALDIESVRQALGYGPINLYGASYGTRLAQEVIRRAPGHLRAVVLDSVIPSSVDRVTATPLAIQQALQRVFKACEQDQTCQRKYPKINQKYHELLSKLRQKPLALTLPGMGQAFDDRTFQAFLLGSLYFAQGIQELPQIIWAADQGKLEVLKGSFALKFAKMAADNVTWAAFYTNECAGEVTYSTPERLQQALKAASEFAQSLQEAPGISSLEIFKVCQGFGLTKPAGQENDPVFSEVPTLLLAGEFDPVTPAAWLPEAAQGLKNAQSVVIQAQAHGSGLTSMCGYQMVAQFLGQPRQQVGTACADKGRIEFK